MIPVHVASIDQNQYLFLRKLQSISYKWFKVESSLKHEEDTAVVAENLSEAMALGYKTWKENSFRLLHCGFRYTLPERDVVGSNALFWQMALSYNSFNGRYYDEEVGHLCYVDFASQEALEIWRKIR